MARPARCRRAKRSSPRRREPVDRHTLTGSVVDRRQHSGDHAFGGKFVPGPRGRGVTGRIVPAEPESEFPRRSLVILEDERIADGYGAAAAARARDDFPAERMVARVLASVDD
ncbi:MAG: hypothetical protein ACKOTB_18635 [Planctomycetia bacterium]